MGNASSRSAKTKSIPNGETIGGGMARGKTVEKNGEEIADNKIVLVVEEEFPSDESYLAEESDMSSTDEEEDEEEDEEMMERLRVLDDARKLKQLAQAFLYPERPVVTSSETACARNYFNRASAPDASMEEERARILADARALKKLAVDYAHPELPVVTTDENACGRNYFDGVSVVNQESQEESDERAKILEDVVALKKLAVDYAHPELPVVTTDETACGRNYFGRASAISQEEADERTRVLEDMLALKKRAVEYMHPELTVVSESTMYGRNYYDRASAPVVESLQDAAELARVMEDLQQLKQLATDYMHPELSVFTTDDTACGRLYFNRPSAAETEEDEERDLIMEDLKALKKLAVDYLHPEISVVTTDDTACARNYFGRASAEDMESMEEADERARVMEEAMVLKKVAVEYLHPEYSVVSSDDTASARNYFNRASAVDMESMEEAQERARVMEDAMALKKFAVEYSHPELPVVSDSTVYARGYFGRFSAPDQLSTEEAQEYDLFLSDVMNLKKFAADYLHPEVAIATSDDTATARNFFDRASAEDIESAEDAEERARIVQEMQILKKLATDYHHPELSCVTTDATALGRNYYDRASAPGHKCISTTRTVEEPTKFIEHEIEDDHYLDEDGFHFAFEDDEEFLSDLKYNVHRLLDPIHHSSSTMEEPEAQKPMDSEEEGKLSRSPSSVMLFGGPFDISY